MGLLIWQVGLGRGSFIPLSNGSLIGWTVFVWLLFLRLITTQLTTSVRHDHLTIGLSGLWRLRRTPLKDIQSVEQISFDPHLDYGGFGVRSDRQGKAYIAQGGLGVRVTLGGGVAYVIGSQHPRELAAVLMPRTGNEPI